MKAVLTTINPPSECTRVLVEKLSGYPLIVIGDQKTPLYDLGGASYVPLREQGGYAISEVLPRNTYCRKNIGYLMAMENNDLIYETDDDNAPLDNWSIPNEYRDALCVTGDKFYNVYRNFSDDHIWPRGIPLEYIFTEGDTVEIYNNFWVQQGLANGSPDVDAIWRMMYDFNVQFQNSSPICTVSYAPFNSQNTWWFKSAFPLMYLPFTCTDRLTDIWRSFIAQRCMIHQGVMPLFTNADVVQHRNEHDYHDDFIQEVQGYVRNEELVGLLEKVQVVDDIYANLYNCYDILIKNKFFDKQERDGVIAWISDCRKILS